MIAVVLLWSISHPDPGIPSGSLGDPRPHRGGVGGKGEQGHSGEATPQRPTGLGAAAKKSQTRWAVLSTILLKGWTPTRTS